MSLARFERKKLRLLHLSATLNDLFIIGTYIGTQRGIIVRYLHQTLHVSETLLRNFISFIIIRLKTEKTRLSFSFYLENSKNYHDRNPKNADCDVSSPITIFTLENSKSKNKVQENASTAFPPTAPSKLERENKLQIIWPPPTAREDAPPAK